jgi:hypothetical protein
LLLRAIERKPVASLVEFGSIPSPFIEEQPVCGNKRGYSYGP